MAESEPVEAPIEDRIKEWREDENCGMGGVIELICEAEEEIRRLKAPNFPSKEVYEQDKRQLERIGVKYSDSFFEIDQGDEGSEAERLWRWMAQLINDAYQVGIRSLNGVKRGPE